MHSAGLSWIPGRSRHPQQRVEVEEAFKKFSEDVKHHLHSGVLSCNVDVLFQDEARIGQRNTISRIWTPKGTRPGLIRQQQYLYAYLYGSACPERDLGVALVLPNVNSQCIGLYQFSSKHR